MFDWSEMEEEQRGKVIASDSSAKKM